MHSFGYAISKWHTHTQCTFYFFWQIPNGNGRLTKDWYPHYYFYSLIIKSRMKNINRKATQRKNTQKNENEIEDYTPSLDNDERQMIIIMLLVNELFQWCGFSFSRFHHFHWCNVVAGCNFYRTNLIRTHTQSILSWAKESLNESHDKNLIWLLQYWTVDSCSEYLIMIRTNWNKQAVPFHIIWHRNCATADLTLAPALKRKVCAVHEMPLSRSIPSLL